MSVLALDLGTTTGFAWQPAQGSIIGGTWDFRPKKNQGSGLRYCRFRECLHRMRLNNGVVRVYFENVRRHKGTVAAHVYGGFKGVLTGWCEEFNISYEPVEVGAIKKFWTGKGNASKDEMTAKAVQLGFSPIDDNESDALALLHMKTGSGL